MVFRTKRGLSSKQFLYSIFCLKIGLFFYFIAAPGAATQSQPSLDTQVEVRQPGWVLHLPLGYVAGRERLKGALIPGVSTDLAYWMPDLNYVDIGSDSPSPIFHPKNAGRNDPGDMSYVVFIRGLKKITSNDNSVILPFDAQRSEMESLDEDKSKFTKTIKYNFHEYRRATSIGNYIFYSNKNMDSYNGFQLFITCTIPGFYFPDGPFCEGRAYDIDKKRLYTILFPFGQMHKFDAIFSNALHLLNRWSAT